MSKEIPILFSSNESAFTSKGLGALSDYIDWNVVESRNGEFEFDMIYPINGAHYSEIDLRSIILAEPNPYDPPQPFRIYEITKPLNGKVRIRAAHISYDLGGIPVGPIIALNAPSAINVVNRSSMVPNPFVMHTDLDTVASIDTLIPKSYRSIMAGQEGSLLDVYGGEYKYDKYDIYLLKNRGEDRGVTLRYGKNLTQLEQEEKCDDVYTGIMGYWMNQITDEDGVEYITYIRSDIKYMTENPPFTRIYIADLTSKFEEMPTVEQLNAAAMEYANKVGLNIPDVKLTVSYEQDPELLETVKLCDTVRVYFERLGVSSTAKVNKTTYNGPRGRYSSIELGSYAHTFAKTLTNTISDSLDEFRSNTILESREIVKRFNEFLEGYMISIESNDGRVSRLEQTLSEISAAVSDANNSLQAVMDSTSLLLDFKQNVEDSYGQDLSNINEYAENNFNIIYSYIRFTNEPAIILGFADGHKVKLKMVNDKIFFFNGTDDSTDLANAFAYFTKDGVFAELINAGKRVQIGNESTNNWILSRSNNGHLTLDLI